MLWRARGYAVAGGLFGVALSQGGYVAIRSDSRGDDEAFDARTGALYARVGRELVVDPAGRYAIDPPVVGWFRHDGHFNRTEVHRLSLAHAPAMVRTVARWPTDPAKDWGTVDAEHRPDFGVALCATGDLEAVSHPDTELGLYRY